MWLFKKKQLLPKEKIERKLPLVLVHKFDTGEVLYSYRPEDWHLICYYHEHLIKEYGNYLALYTKTKEAVNLSLDEIIKASNEIMNTKDIITNASNINKIAEYLKNQSQSLSKGESELKEILFCMFFILGDEPELTYNEHFNKRKLELINSNPSLKANLFFYLDETTRTIASSFNLSTKDALKEINLLSHFL